VRDYQIENGVAIPKHIETKADVRILGRAELSIDYSNVSRQEFADEAELEPSNR
jgi:hypothetical protein